MNYRINKTFQGQAILESVEQRGPVPAISVQLPTEAAAEIVNAVTVYHKRCNMTEDEKLAELLQETEYLDAGDTQRLIEKLASLYERNKSIIRNMDAEAIGLALRTAATLIKHRTGE